MPSHMHLSSVGAQDIGVTYCTLGYAYKGHKAIHTGIEDGHGGAAEELTASGTKLNLLYSHVSRKPSEVTIDLFSGPALGALDRYLVVRPERIRFVYVRCCRRSGGQRSWKAVHMLALVRSASHTERDRDEVT